jgi:ubiquitin C-terminal hydrolase
MSRQGQGQGQGQQDKNSNVSLNVGDRYEKYKNKGLTGLANLGNTCFINALLQIISHTYELDELLDDADYKTKLNDSPDSKLLLSWDELRLLMWSENCTISPGGFIHDIRNISKQKNNSMFSSMSQNDMPEFLTFLFDIFHNALKRKVSMTIDGRPKNKRDKMAKLCFEMIKKTYTASYSEIFKMFYGIQVSTLLPENPKDQYDYLSIRPEPFMIISLPIPTRCMEGREKTGSGSGSAECVTLMECFDLNCEKEFLHGENAWFNENLGKKQNVYKRLVYWSLPDVMILDIKRFEYSPDTFSYVKNQTAIRIPVENVDFSKYVEGYNKESYVYDLFGICNHHGDENFGHYTSTVKTANSKWYNFNDTNVKEVPIPKNEIVGNTPYCLFYRKRHAHK